MGGAACVITYCVFFDSQPIIVHDAKLILCLGTATTYPCCSRLLKVHQSFWIVLMGKVVLSHCKLHTSFSISCA